MDLGVIKMFFLAAKIGDDRKQVSREQLETVTSAEYHGRFTEI